MSAKSKSINLTEGDITHQLMLFVWPIMLANIFQQVYNLTNSMIVGNYINTNALSAVSSTQSITLIANFFFYGVSTASGILVSNYYGAGEKGKVRMVIQTSLIVSFLLGVSFTAAGEIFTPWMMNLSNVNEVIYREAEIYLRVFMLGYLPLFISNVIFFIMRSLGDSKHPLYYLMTSCVINIVLGVIFVRVLHMGVSGPALATVISQLIVDVLAVRALQRIDPDLRFDLKRLEIDAETVRRLAELGIPAAVQNMLISLSNLVVQAYVNLFPVAAIAGIGVANKVSTWVQIPMQSISTIGTNFVGQNLGAKKYTRVKNGIKLCNRIATVITIICASFVFVFAERFIALFDTNPDVVRYGAAMTRFTVFSYVPLTWSHIYNGCCRGAGNVKIPMIIAVLCQCVAKYFFVTIGLRISFDIHIIYLSSALAFSLAGIVASLYFHLSPWTKKRQLR